jgi:hypothetical protein
MIFLLFFSITTKAKTVACTCSLRAFDIYSSIDSALGINVYHNTHSLPSDAALTQSSVCSFRRGTILLLNHPLRLHLEGKPKHPTNIIDGY